MREDSLRGFYRGMKSILNDLDSESLSESQLALRLNAGGGYYVTHGDDSV